MHLIDQVNAAHLIYQVNAAHLIYQVNAAHLIYHVIAMHSKNERKEIINLLNFLKLFPDPGGPTMRTAPDSLLLR